MIEVSFVLRPSGPCPFPVASLDQKHETQSISSPKSPAAKPTNNPLQHHTIVHPIIYESVLFFSSSFVLQGQQEIVSSLHLSTRVDPCRPVSCIAEAEDVIFVGLHAKDRVRLKTPSGVGHRAIAATGVRDS